MPTKKFTLPKGFDPEDHVRGRMKKPRLKRGLSLVNNEEVVNSFTVMKVSGKKASPVVRCWHCTTRPNGSMDCVIIPCPWEGEETIGPLESPPFLPK